MNGVGGGAVFCYQFIASSSQIFHPAFARRRICRTDLFPCWPRRRLLSSLRLNKLLSHFVNSHRKIKLDFFLIQRHRVLCGTCLCLLNRATHCFTVKSHRAFVTITRAGLLGYMLPGSTVAQLHSFHMENKEFLFLLYDSSIHTEQMHH